MDFFFKICFQNLIRTIWICFNYLRKLGLNQRVHSNDQFCWWICRMVRNVFKKFPKPSSNWCRKFSVESYQLQSLKTICRCFWANFKLFKMMQNFLTLKHGKNVMCSSFHWKNIENCMLLYVKFLISLQNFSLCFHFLVPVL